MFRPFQGKCSIYFINKVFEDNIFIAALNEIYHGKNALTTAIMSAFSANSGRQ